jgi:hypothetical protein
MQGVEDLLARLAGEQLDLPGGRPAVHWSG